MNQIPNQPQASPWATGFPANFNPQMPQPATMGGIAGGNRGTGGFSQPNQPRAGTPRASGNGQGPLPGISQGATHPSYVTGPGGTRPILPGQTAQLAPGEVHINEAAPGETTLGDQGRQAVKQDYGATVDAQKRAQGRYDKAIDLYKQGNADIDKWQGDYEKKLMDKGNVPDFAEARGMLRSAVSGYEDRSAKDAAASMSGIEQQYSQAAQDINNDPNMPDNVKQQKLSELNFQKNQQKQQTITGMFTASNEALASLRVTASGGLANMAQSEAAMKQQRLAQLHASHMNAEGAKSQGRDRLAQLYTEYPDSVVSKTDAFLAMVGMNNLPGSRGAGFRG